MIMFKPSIFFIYLKINSLKTLLDLTDYRILIIVLLLLCITVLKLGIKPIVILIGIYNWLQKKFSFVYFIPYVYIFNLICLLSYTPCWADQMFIPSGVPQKLKSLLFILEFLSIRLFSTMLTGNSLIHILFDTSLSVLLMISIVALLVIYISVIFEFIGAFLQAYVFGLRFIIYLIK